MPSPSPATAAAPASRRARDVRRPLLLLVTCLVAVAGFVYELILISLGTFLIGNTVFQTGIVLATFVTTMGVGSLLAKPLSRSPITAFLVVETTVALLGGVSALALYAAFAWLDLYQPALILVAGAIGLLVGCEIPLLMTLIQRVRREAAGTSVADLLAADYLGAVIAGVGFPLAMLPAFGEIRSALAVGVANALAGVAVLAVFRHELTRRHLLALAGTVGAAVALLLGVAAWAERLEVRALQALFDEPIAIHERTPYQEIVVTRSFDGRDTRLFLNGDLQFSSVDEYRYHEPLVHPALAGPRRRVLVLGGGDGLALREVVRYPDVEEVVQVEIDRRMLELARQDDALRALNRGSLDDPRVELVVADAFSWLRGYRGQPFDVVIADFPDPDSAAVAKLYAREFYGMLRARALSPGGRLAVQAGSPYFAPDAFWCVRATVAAAGFATAPYHVDVPSFGDWGFVLARVGGPPRLALDAPAPLRFLDAGTLAAAAVFPRDRQPRPVDVSTLNRPRILDYQARGWRQD